MPRPVNLNLHTTTPDSRELPEHGYSRWLLRRVYATLSPTIRLLRRSTIVLGAGLILSGCPGMSPKDNARFQALVEKTVSPGMSLADAERHLKHAGFSCDDRVAAPEISCTRDRQSLLPYACIQRVNLLADPDRTTVTEVIPKPIACAGL
jgi:hypothetical protein